MSAETHTSPPRNRLAENAWLMRRYLQAEWFGSPFHLMSLSGRKPDGVAAQPRSPRPPNAARGRALLSGVYAFAGHELPLGPEGEPFDRPNPSQAFAEELHRMNWLGDLVAVGQKGEEQALRLLLEWRRVFGKWNSFSWSPPVLERRVINIAANLRPALRHASDLEKSRLCESLARQARQLLKITDGPMRAAEHACAAAVAGAALGGRTADKLLQRALAKLAQALPVTVLPDGGHASRSPEATLDLLLDLLTLEDGLSQRGLPVPDEMSRALDRLAAALRVLALPDGRLACFQGGEAGRAEDVTAARQGTDLDANLAPGSLPHTGYERLTGTGLTVIVDSAPPADGPWSETACAQPLAMELLMGADRLITNCGWSPYGMAPEALRMTTGGSTLCVAEGSAGAPARGRFGKAFLARLKGGPREVVARRQETDQGMWLELAHDGWEPAYGVRHERLFFLDRAADELRGEDRIKWTRKGGTRVLPIAIRFHLDPAVKASLARDRKSVLLQGPNSPGLWLRNDAEDVTIEHSVRYEGGLARRTTQVVLRHQARAGEDMRVRWKFAAVSRTK